MVPGGQFLVAKQVFIARPAVLPDQRIDIVAGDKRIVMGLLSRLGLERDPKLAPFMNPKFVPPQNM
jgi:hypothetical protein